MRLRFSAAVFILFLSQTLPGQYYHLATPADGSVVYFDTVYPRTGTSDARQGRIYTVDSSGLQLFAERQREEFAGNPTYTSFYRLAAPTVSSDGAVRAFRGWRQCIGQGCSSFTQFSESAIQRAGLPDLYTKGGAVQLSANGRYALLTATPAEPYWNGGLLDLFTGFIQEFRFTPMRPFTPGRQVADNGTVVCAERGGLAVIRGAEGRLVGLYPSELVEQAVIDPAGRVIVYTSRWSYPYSSNVRVRALDLGTGAQWTVLEGSADFYQPILSDDGRQLLFLTNSRFDDSGRVGPPQVYVMGLDGTKMRPLTADPAGIREATLSGNGKVAYAVTLAGHLLRIEVESGESTELLPRTLAAARDNVGNVAGSLLRFTGVGYLGPDGTPEPVAVRMGGKEAPVAWSEPGELAVQVPWELAGVFVKVTLTAEVPPAPFVPPAVEFEFVVQSFGPQMQPLPAEYGKPGPEGVPFGLVLHANSRVVGVEEPAQPGETVRAVVLGLGPVDPPVPTGQPAPVDGPPSVVRTAMSCWTWVEQEKWPIPITAAALARGELGTYHLDLALPLDLPPTTTNSRGAIQIQCNPADPSSDLIINLPFVFPPATPAKSAQ